MVFVLVVLVVVVLRWALVVVVMVVLVLAGQMMVQWAGQKLLQVPKLQPSIGPLRWTLVCAGSGAGPC